MAVHTIGDVPRQQGIVSLLVVLSNLETLLFPGLGGWHHAATLGITRHRSTASSQVQSQQATYVAHVQVAHGVGGGGCLHLISHAWQCGRIVIGELGTHSAAKREPGAFL